MTAHITLTAEFPSYPIATMRAELDHTDKKQSLRAFIAAFQAILTGGSKLAMVRSNLASACASATATFVVGSMSDGDTISIAGTALTARTAPTLSSEFAILSTSTLTAAAFAACVNANATTQKVARATSAAAVATVTCVYPGPIGNEVRFTKSSSGVTVTGAGFLASGSSDEVDAYQMGYTPAA